MPTIEERLEAITQTLELAAQMQQRTERIVGILAEDQVKTEKVMARIAVLVRDHELRLREIES